MAQHDGEPAHGQLPTTGWLPGEFIRDEHPLVLNSSGDDVAVKEMWIGLYDPNSGTRLPLIAPGGGVLGDHVVVEFPRSAKGQQ